MKATAILVRNWGWESNRASQLMKNSGIPYIKEFSNGEECPALVVKGVEFSFDGILEIRSYIQSYKAECAKRTPLFRKKTHFHMTTNPQFKKALRS